MRCLFFVAIVCLLFVVAIVHFEQYCMKMTKLTINQFRIATKKNDFVLRFLKERNS